MRLGAEKLGTALVVIMTIVVLALAGVSGALRLAVDDLHAQAAIARAEEPRPMRSPLGQQLSAAFAGDLSPENLAGLDARGQELDHRADRLLELSAVVALAGMLVALFTGRPASEVAQLRAERRRVVNSGGNGTL